MASDRPGPDPVPPGLDVPVAPLGAGPKSSSRAPILGAIAIAGVVLAAILLARAFPATPDGPLVALPSVPSATSDAASAIPERSLAIPAAPRLRAAELVEGVLDGSLDGRLIYADAFVRASCPPDGASACDAPQLAIDGLGLEVTADGDPGTAMTTAPRHGLQVLAVRGTRLAYLGSLIVSPTGPPPLAQLRAAAGPDGEVPGPTLYDVAGWLVVDPPCVTAGGPAASRPATACPARAPFLAQDEPLSGGLLRSDAGQRVTLSPALWGVDPSTTVTEGPFLVAARPGEEPAWEVVARYDPSHSVRVVIP